MSDDAEKAWQLASFPIPTTGTLNGYKTAFMAGRASLEPELAALRKELSKSASERDAELVDENQSLREKLAAVERERDEWKKLTDTLRQVPRHPRPGAGRRRGCQYFISADDVKRAAPSWCEDFVAGVTGLLERSHTMTNTQRARAVAEEICLRETFCQNEPCQHCEELSERLAKIILRHFPEPSIEGRMSDEDFDSACVNGEESVITEAHRARDRELALAAEVEDLQQALAAQIEGSEMAGSYSIQRIAALEAQLAEANAKLAEYEDELYRPNKHIPADQPCATCMGSKIQIEKLTGRTVFCPRCLGTGEAKP